MVGRGFVFDFFRQYAEWVTSTVQKRLQELVINVPDFPKPGINFKDITPIFLNGEALRDMVDLFAERYQDRGVDAIAAVESRGFLLGAPLAAKLGISLVLVRKHGKLPRATYQQRYALEYGEDHMEMHQDALRAGQRVVLIDDLLATGGTANAAKLLIERTGATILEAAFLVELTFLGGREKLGCECFTVLEYAAE